MSQIIISENRQEAFQGVWIPKELYLDEKLNTYEKILMSEILSLDKLERGCIANNKHFADFLGISERRVQEFLNELEKVGYIKREYKYRKNTKEIDCRIIKPTFRWCEISHGGSAKTRMGGGAKSRADKNTSFEENKEEENNSLIMEFLANQKSNVYEFARSGEYYNKLREQVARVCLTDLYYTEEQTIRVVDVIVGFYDLYNEIFNENHPYLTDDKLSDCIENLSCIEYLFDFDYKTCMKCFEQYFNTEFSWDIDYHLPHFCSEKIIHNRMYEVIFA